MANELSTITINNKLEDVLKYHFSIDGTNFIYEIIKFNSIEEYDSYREDEDIAIFNNLFKDDSSIKHIISLSWDIDGKVNSSIRLNELIKTIEWLGKEYLFYNWPDIVFYEAENFKFHRIYRRLFSSFGYSNTRNIGNYHIFTLDDRVGKNIKEENDEI